MQHDAIDWQMSLQVSPRRGLQWKFGAFTFICRSDKCTQERNCAKNFLGTNSEYVQFEVLFFFLEQAVAAHEGMFHNEQLTAVFVLLRLVLPEQLFPYQKTDRRNDEVVIACNTQIS